ncbi:MAG TPA: hypothetical protein PKE10_03380 [Candidatus Saccharibacteria bacterium]|jgi:hypothetical protein|nr:hypothetical protein [Candidatus Saccharibacteria bacterium]
MNDWSVTYHGNLFEILQNEKGWEKAARAPGVRVILDDQAAGKILMKPQLFTNCGIKLLQFAGWNLYKVRGVE